MRGKAQDVHKLCGMGVEYIIKNSLLRRSLDNVTVVVIAFSNFKHTLFGHQVPQNMLSGGEDSVENTNSIEKIYPIPEDCKKTDTHVKAENNDRSLQ